VIQRGEVKEDFEEVAEVVISRKPDRGTIEISFKELHQVMVALDFYDHFRHRLNLWWVYGLIKVTWN